MTKFLTYRNSWPWGDTVTFIADDGKATGEVSFESQHPFGYICNLMVHPSARRQGRADRLLELLEAEILKRGRNWAVLGVANKGWKYHWYIRKGYYDTRMIDGRGFIEMRKIL